MLTALYSVKNTGMSLPSKDDMQAFLGLYSLFHPKADLVVNEMLPFRSKGSKTAFFKQMLRQLIAFKQKKGHCLVPRRIDGTTWQLGFWVGNKRNEYRSGALDQDIIAILNELGFCWHKQHASFDFNVAALQDFKKKNGHMVIPQRYPDGTVNSLGVWIMHVRSGTVRARHSKYRKAKLDELNFSWDTRQEYWEIKFKELKDWRKKNGGRCRMTMKVAKEKNILPLYNWCGKQRAKGLAGLGKRLYERLDEICFWTT
jgi:Helicase associated domain